MAAANKSVAAVQNQINEVLAKTEREQFEVDYRRTERDRLQLMVTAGQTQLEIMKAKLTSQDRSEFEVSYRTTAVLQELASLDDALSGVSGNEKVTEVVKHYPTPMAKTVFGKEVHFRLMESKLCYVPFDEFVARLKEDAPKQIWKLKDVPSITESIGPIQGFRMKYTLRRETVAVPVSGGVAKAERAALEHFVLVPMTENLGEPVEQALAANSDFRSIMGQYNPKAYTVTVWVYPDSFQHFRKVRDALLKLGFITAGRPMPEGHPIGGSPEGSRSAAQ